MVLAIHSDAGYLNEEGARSRAGGHHFLSENVNNPSNNGAIYNEASIIKSVMSFAAEAKIGALYISMHKKGLKNATFWRRCVIYNPPHLFEQII